MIQHTSIQQHRLTVHTTGRTDLIEWKHLVRIEADSNYSRLFLTDGKTLFVARVLKKFEEELDSTVFIRAHKTHLVNIRFIKAYCRGAHPLLLLVNGETIPVARNKKKRVGMIGL